jgi:hypothetical protein
VWVVLSDQGFQPNEFVPFSFDAYRRYERIIDDGTEVFGLHGELGDVAIGAGNVRALHVAAELTPASLTPIRAYRQRESLHARQLQMPTIPLAEHQGSPNGCLADLSGSPTVELLLDKLTSRSKDQ